mmetsp:Transcript_91344/g.212462  ORF Transcript_91344/g.212462 Transcript_91344/m.212462 type:complete len:498 (-) Transcript_91344:678-2171(-)
MNPHALGVVHIPPEGMCQKMQLVAETEQSPVLEGEVGEERLRVPNIADVLDAKNVELVVVVVRALLWLLLALRLCLHRLVLCLLDLRVLARLHLLHVLVFFGPLLGCFRPLVVPLVPLLQLTLPSSPLLAEPFRRHDVFFARGQLPAQNPFSQVLRALRLFEPLISDVVEALVFRWYCEFGEGRTQSPCSHVRRRAFSKPWPFLLIGELDLRRLLILHLVVLLFSIVLLIAVEALPALVLVFAGKLLLLRPLRHRLLAPLLLFVGRVTFLLLPGLFCCRSVHGLLCRLDGPLVLSLQISLLLLSQPPPDDFRLSGLELDVGFVLLLLQQDRVHLLFEVPCRFPDHDLRNSSEVGRAESFERLPAILLYQIGLHLHVNEVSLMRLGHGVEDAAYALVVHLRNVEAHVRLVVGCLPRVALGSPHPTPLGPIEDLPVAQLAELRMFLQEHVQPVESTLVREAHREDDLVLSLLGRCLGGHDDVPVGSVLHHATPERHLGC